ncbi:hypothetical protein PLIP_a0057 [Pseudoalteromonas lipolytica LMEB 39]|nr:hypothetical protein [Pseudoalteromonas lipolytica LMEB 39]
MVTLDYKVCVIDFNRVFFVLNILYLFVLYWFFIVNIDT